MIDGRALTEEQANAVWDVLADHAGASEEGREDFVLRQAEGCTEYRFGGWLGSGGKFWNANRRWYVSAYPEDTRTARAQAIEATNAALSGLRASYEALDAALNPGPVRRR